MKLRSGTNLEFNIQNVESNTILELPYIYYLGYTVTLENNRGITKLEPYESENGFVAIQLDEGEGKVEVKYTGTIVMKASMVVSILGFTAIIGYCCFNRRIFLIKT